MSPSIRRTQTLGVTALVGAVVLALSLLQMATLARMLLEQAARRAEVVGLGIVQQAALAPRSEASAYNDIRASAGVQSALAVAQISLPEVVVAVVVDPSDIVVASGDAVLATVGRTLPPRDDLARLLRGPAWIQLQVILGEVRIYEWRQPLLLGDRPFGEVRIRYTTDGIRQQLLRSMRPVGLFALGALVMALLVSLVLARVIVRPIHVLTSGLTQLGRGELTTPLDLREAELQGVGDLFERIAAQLQAAVGTTGASEGRVAALTRRMAALGRLTAGVAHEVKNPLNAMTIHLELLKQQLTGPAPGDALRHAEVIGTEITRLDEVVQGFVKFVRPEEMAMSEVPIGLLLASVRDSVADEAARARVDVQVEVPRMPLVTMGDAPLLRQALLNLAQNALQAMPGGGRLIMQGRDSGDGRIELRLEDTGVGIAPDDLARIFDLYFTTRTHGSGIGLSLVFRTVQMHDGDIRVESTVGVGSTFVVALPRAR
ncbi:MAG: HAMP domain-containing protein [Acidobacteria bacterium]|nr:HAMP domain-containing protein [Acidobacteriota bacterium]